MIFIVSKRTFLNVICPLRSKEELLNANYYIADCRSPDNVKDTVDNVHYDNILEKWVDDKGEEVNQEDDEKVKKAITRFNVRYGTNVLNVESYATHLLSDGVEDNEMAVRIEDYLMRLTSMSRIYDEVYMPPKRGNGVLYIIYYSFDSILNDVHVVARHLAENFGEDICFVDPMRNKYVKGQSFYPGNKERSKIVLAHMKDALLITNYKAVAKASKGYDIPEAVETLTNHLVKFGYRDAVKLYNMLWPDDPLPPGNYTLEELKNIIMSRTLDTDISSYEEEMETKGFFQFLERYNPSQY